MCFGDSITQGTIGAAYVDLLAAALPGVRVVNAGVDGDTTYNLLDRLETAVIAAKPDLVLVMVGLNDFGTAYGERLSRAYYRVLKRVPLAIDVPTFEAFYDGILTQLQRAGIPAVLCTPTTLGELPDTPGQHMLDAYARVVATLAGRYGLPWIDVRAAFVDALRRDPRRGPVYHLWMVPLDAWRISRGSSYEQISTRRGYQLLVDGVHLNASGARLVAETVLPTVRTLLKVE
jgi:lysophospholipase L1-like esterase